MTCLPSNRKHDFFFLQGHILHINLWYLLTFGFLYVFQSCMNLPPDKLKLLSQCDKEKKWELVCDEVRIHTESPESLKTTVLCSVVAADVRKDKETFCLSDCHRLVNVSLWISVNLALKERFQVKSPPSTYLTKIKSFYQDQGGVPRRVSATEQHPFKYDMLIFPHAVLPFESSFFI